MLTEYPKLIQVEPTNKCNYSCSMCLNAVGNSENHFLSLDSFQSLAEEVFPNLEKLVLYGFGEPLIHPNFIEMLEISRKYLPSESKVTFTTNGSLLNKNRIDTIVKKQLADEIVFSCDMLLNGEIKPELHSLENRNVEANLRYLIERNVNKKIRIGIQSVIMKSNINQIEDVISKFGLIGIDFIALSHLFPFFKNLQEEVLFTMISQEALSILKENNNKWKEIILGVSKEKFAEKMQETYKQLYKNKANIKPKIRPFSEIFVKAQAKAKEKNVHLNVSLYLKEKDKLKALHELEKLFNKFSNIAEERNVELILPAIFPKFSDRRCPFQTANASVIRSDGNVVPCFNYLWDHESYLNNHVRENSSFTFGNIHQKPFLE
ncbi:MAG: radical SAM protein, partial [Candidatus Heimdallarchaeota archaeon]|nr:radical SAM protein [Candidatus Heimdallarchaeota archaeon]MCK5144758.1 radical SAM protein [Candidatus Heimdallarchaeota archaeon]